VSGSVELDLDSSSSSSPPAVWCALARGRPAEYRKSKEMQLHEKWGQVRKRCPHAATWNTHSHISSSCIARSRADSAVPALGKHFTEVCDPLSQGSETSVQLLRELKGAVK